MRSCSSPRARPPDRFLIFQLLVGTWPAALLGDGPLEQTALAAYAERLKGVVTKSLREAKVHSTWTTPDEAYEGATLRLIDAALTGVKASRFLAAFRPFAARVAALGAANSFAQTVLKFTIPGMPDLYQGCELWDLSMVDPDNRRPIDFALRAEALQDIRKGPDDRAATMARLWGDWRDARFKLALTRWLLEARAKEPALFASGDYLPLAIVGAAADTLFAFARRFEGTCLVVVIQRFPTDAIGDDARVALPDELVGRMGTGIVGGTTIEGRALVAAAPLLGGLPAAVYRFGVA